MPRVMCVYFPGWPLQRLRQQRLVAPDRPNIVVRPAAGKGLKVVHACARAQREGVRVGMPQAEAMAIAPDVVALEEDLDADREVLEQVAEWAKRFSPVVGIEDSPTPACLWIEVTGGSDCFGGEETLVRKACREFREQGWFARIALADTLGAAWAVVHHPREVTAGCHLASFGGGEKAQAARTAMVTPPFEGGARGGKSSSESLVDGEGRSGLRPPLTPPSQGGEKTKGQAAMVSPPFEGGEKEKTREASVVVCPDGYLLPPGTQEQVLATLPACSLRLSPATVALLENLGLHRVDQLAELPRNDVAQRFGASVLLRLDQALGWASEAIEPFHAPAEASASRSFEYPLWQCDAIAVAIESLLGRLESALEKRGRGIRVLECLLDHEEAEPSRLECGLAQPARDARYIARMVRERLERIQLAGPVYGIRLRALVVEPIAEQPAGLFASTLPLHQATFARLVDQLAARLGNDAIVVPRLLSDPQPELACRYVSALHAEPTTSDKDRFEDRSETRAEPVSLATAPIRTGGRKRKRHDVSAKAKEEFLRPSRRDYRIFAHRPLRIFPRPARVDVVAAVPDGTPARFRHGNVDYPVVRCQGPERIETGWWRGGDQGRDYFIVHTQQGTRWWLYRRIEDGAWFLHGCFD